MSSEIIVSIITVLGTVFGVIISNNKVQAVMEEKISELTREVRLHNNFAQRVPIIEEKIKNMEEKINDLEKK